MKIKNILILLLITVTLCGCDKKDPSSDDRPKETPNVAPELNMGRMINHINDINKVFSSDEYDLNDFIEEEDGTKFYKYTGDNAEEISAKLAGVYQNPYGGAFFRSKLNDEKERELYVSKPLVCDSVLSISMSDVDYSEPDVDGFISFRIFIEEKNYDYMTSLGADENGYYKLQSLIYPCTVIKEEGAEDEQ